jgi:hypothetical protein
MFLPDLRDRHRLIHVVIQDVAGLASECVEYPDCTITMTGSNVFVIGVESHAEGLLGGIAEGVLVRDFDVGVLHYLQTIEG